MIIEDKVLTKAARVKLAVLDLNFADEMALVCTGLSPIESMDESILRRFKEVLAGMPISTGNLSEDSVTVRQDAARSIKTPHVGQDSPQVVNILGLWHLIASAASKLLI